MAKKIMIEGVPTDSQIEEFLDGLGFGPESETVQEHAGPEGHEHPDEEPDPEDEGEGVEGDEPTLPDEGDDEEVAPEEPDPEEEEPDDLLAIMARALANTFAMYLRAHVFHWNVVGPDFFQYHTYLDALNGELFAAVDPLAEHLRAVGGLAPSGIGEFASLSTVADPGDPQPEPAAMWAELLEANDEVMEALHAAFSAAGDDQGLLNPRGLSGVDPKCVGRRAPRRPRQARLVPAILGRPHPVAVSCVA